jgi:PAS domain S-box-containing protein
MAKEYNILIVEDSANDVELARHELSRFIPYYTLQAVTERDAYLESLRTFKPDIILADLQLPSFDGFSALKIAKEINPEIPVIMLTGLISEVTALEFIRLGAFDYVAKNQIGRLGLAVFNALEQSRIIHDKNLARELLQRSEKTYHLMFLNNPQPMVIYDFQSLDFLEANKAAVAFFGYEEEEWLSLNIRDILQQDEYLRLRKILSESRDLLAPATEWRCLNKKGEVLFVEVNSHRISYNNRQANHVLIKDITLQKQVEAALFYNEKKYRSFFENSFDAILLASPDGKIFEANPAACKMMGYSAEEFTKHRREDLVDASSPLFKKFIHNREQFGQARQEFTFTRKDGTTFEGEITSALFEDAHGQKKLSVIIRDITQRKEAENSLRQNMELFRSLFEENLSVMLLMDPDSGKIKDANPAAEQFYGWTHEQLLEMRIQDINVLGEAVKTELRKAKQQKRIRYEFKHKTAFGDVRDVEVFVSNIIIQGKVYLHSIIHDITERKDAERQIKLLNRAIEQNPVSIMITDPKGNIEYVNKKFTLDTGYTYKESIGRNPRFLKSGTHSREFYASMWNTILSGHYWEGNLLNKRKNGELYWINMIVSPLLDDDGKIVHFIATREDITEKKAMIDQLVTAKEKAEENDKLKTAFLHNISHEIRTPLNAIIGFSSILGNPKLPTKKRKEFIEVIKVSNDQLLSIITGIISLATLEAGQEIVIETETSVNEILRNVYEQFLVTRIPDAITFSYSTALPDEIAITYTDRVKLMQVLVNLVGNAMKFTQKGKIRFGYTMEEGMFQFFVEDSGIGIAKEMHEAIFERFRQVDNSATRKFGGAGLGLALSKGYIEMLGGSINLFSEPGIGSTFTFTIPYKPVNLYTTAPAEESPKEDSVAVEEKTVLVAEDEINNFLLIQEILSSMKLKVIHAENGLEAVKLCSDKTLPDIVLMDIKMPVMDGIEATRQIKKIAPDLPVIAITAYALDVDRKRIDGSGFDDYVAKPIHQGDLTKLLLKHLKI